MKRSRGFTLIEVMVALAVASIAIPALLTLITNQLQGTQSIKQDTYAMWLAENQLTRLRLQHEMTGALLTEPIDDKTEMADQVWLWQIEPEQTVLGAVLRYRITVSTEDNPEEPLATLDTFINE